jgi:oligopeptide/dipeptide ABC transporter ATP-binding protein
MPLVELETVHKGFEGPHGLVRAVSGVSLTIDRGTTLAVVGESGSGKSTLGRLALRLLDVDSGVVRFDGIELGTLDRRAMRAMRARMQVVFQEPYESLDPRMRVEQIVSQPLEIHQPELERDERERRVHEVLQEVGLEAQQLSRLPRQLSGGQQQRVGIARAIVTRPDFIVLDEPTSSLDLSIRAQIIDLLLDLQSRHGLTYLLISHDMQTVEYFAGRVVIMYRGTVLEEGDARTIFSQPVHPYSQALISARLSPDPDEKKARVRLLGEISPASAAAVGCPLVGRCPISVPECSESPIPLTQVGEDHAVACIRSQSARELVTRDRPDSSPLG